MSPDVAPTVQPTGASRRGTVKMRAAVVHEYGDSLSRRVSEPRATDGHIVVLVTAGLNPVDPGIVAGGSPFQHPRPPFVAGYSGVGTLHSGQHVYFQGPTEPYGALAELTLVKEQDLIPFSDNIDDVLVAALGPSGLAAWLALQWRAQLVRGETVLVLGSGGAVGQVAVQAARILGAGRGGRRTQRHFPGEVRQQGRTLRSNS